jgi:hypothetical protein
MCRLNHAQELEYEIKAEGRSPAASEEIAMGAILRLMITIPWGGEP